MQHEEIVKQIKKLFAKNELLSISITHFEVSHDIAGPRGFESTIMRAPRIKCSYVAQTTSFGRIRGEVEFETFNLAGVAASANIKKRKKRKEEAVDVSEELKKL